MPLVRLASFDDYEVFDLLGRTMYRVAWCEKMCPGNPTDDPQTGIMLFNEWQCAVAAGHETIENPIAKLDLIVSWCFSNHSATSLKIASEIVSRYKQRSYTISLDFNPSDFEEPGLAYRYELAFLNEQAMKLPAERIMQLQALMQVVI